MRVMHSRLAASVIVGVVLSGVSVDAQDLSRYREFELGSNMASVAKIAGVMATAKIVHRRPALIQELEWRPPYNASVPRVQDPVRDATLTFYNDQLFRIVITYDYVRTEGLTNEDMIEAMAATYGVPLVPNIKQPGQVSRSVDLDESAIFARWDDGDQMLTLSRGRYPVVFRLVAVSKAPNELAQAATLEAVRLDALEAPQRESDRRTKEVNDAIAAQDKARRLNKAAFRP